MQRTPAPAIYRGSIPGRSRDNSDPVPDVWFGSPREENKALREELEDEDPCFVFTAAEYFLERIDIEEYFGRLIGHLQADVTLHRFDNAKGSNIRQLLEVDLVAGAIKSHMLNQAFPRLQAADASKFKELCLLVYRTNDASTLRQRAIDAEAPLESLPPAWLDVLAVIAYARRHEEVLRLLVTYPAPQPRSTFNLLDYMALRTRVAATGKYAEHPTPGADRLLCEARLWTILLQSPGGWIQFPLSREDSGLHGGLTTILLNFSQQPSLRAHSDIEELCRALSAVGIAPKTDAFSRILSIRTIQDSESPRGIKPCSLAAAEMFLECFPIAKVAAAESRSGRAKRLGPTASATILMPIAQWPKNNRDRLAVMRLLLESGCDPDDKMETNSLWGDSWGSKTKSRRKLYDAPLHQAAERGDDQMVKLLLEFGADRNLASDWNGDTPAKRARAYNRFGTAAKLEGS
ncbi:hypothetical protein B0T18DRAFT_389998 [Schizothecium vesticola]|uniref:Ankyrin n=1 Tax=Schizothecium vesticola TaxID=314040 RepID=A0AA40F3Q1_9PEZI|nr:hypothetical protein B0T18DRAFT_389998 [Schizothecium vesticola]